MFRFRKTSARGRRRTASAALVAMAMLVLTIGASGDAGAVGHVGAVGGNASPLSTVSAPTGITPAAGLHYSYAPSAVQEGSVRHVFYCGNTVSGVVHDHIMLSVGTLAGGTWTYGAPVVAFGPEQAPAWANYHTCDPEALKGSFAWSGHVYSWAMFFTGYGCRNSQEVPCSAADESPNQVGVAFADSLDAGPSGWHVYPAPLVGFTTEYGGQCAQGDYCVGQPSATSIDGAGRFLLFYEGKGGLVQRQFDLSNITSAVIGAEVPLPTGADAFLPGDFVHNASVVYVPAINRFVAAIDGGAFDRDPNGPPVQTDVVVISIPGGSVWSGTGSWRVEGRITPANSGHAFNHNAGIVRDPFGGSANPSVIEVVHTVADGRTVDGGWGVWTYRLWTNSLPMPIS